MDVDALAPTGSLFHVELFRLMPILGKIFLWSVVCIEHTLCGYNGWILFPSFDSVLPGYMNTSTNPLKPTKPLCSCNRYGLTDRFTRIGKKFSYRQIKLNFCQVPKFRAGFRESEFFSKQCSFIEGLPFRRCRHRTCIREWVSK